LVLLEWLSDKFNKVGKDDPNKLVSSIKKYLKDNKDLLGYSYELDN